MKKLLILIFFYCFIFFTYSLPQTNSLLETGIDNFNKGQYQFAVSNLTKYIQIIEENRDNPKAYYYLSISYYFLENYRMSLHYIKELSTRYGLSNYTTQSYFWKGLIHQNLKEWQAAEEAFLKYIALMPNSDLTERAYLAAANSEIALEKYDTAEKNLKIIIDEYKDKDKYGEASVLYAYVLTRQGKEKEAEDFLIGWIGRLGEKGEGYEFRDRFWLYYAEIAFKKKKYDVAKLFYKKIDIYSKNSLSSDIALLRLSEIEEISGNSKDAKEYLVRLSNEYPYSKYNIDASLSLGLSRLKNNEYKDAMIIFEQAKTLAEKNLLRLDELTTDERERLEVLLNDSLFYIGEAYNNQDEYDKALEYYQKVVDGSKYLQDESLLKILEIYIRKNKLDEANKIITRYNNSLVKNNALKDRYLIYKAELELLSGNYQSSLKTLSDIEDNKKYSESMVRIKAKNYVKLGRLEDAVKILEDIFPFLQYNEKSKTALQLVEFYFKLGNYEKTIFYTDSAQAFSDNLKKEERQELTIKGGFYSAISYMQLKELDKGINLLESLLKSGKNNTLPDDLAELVNDSYYYLGWLYYKASNYTKALENFRIASTLPVKKNLKDDSYFMEAWSYYSSKDYKKAADKFNAIYEKYYPESLGIKAFYLAGKSYQNLNDMTKALNIFNKIYKDFPDSDYKDDALYEIITYNLKNKKLEEANNLIIDFKRKFSDSPLYKDLIILEAEAMLSERRFSEASSIYSYYIKNFKDEKNLESVYYWAGYSAFKAGDFHAAEEYLTNLIENYKESHYLKEALNVLVELYRSEKEYLKEENAINRLLEIEKDRDTINGLNKRLRVLRIIKNGTPEEEAFLTVNAEDGTVESRFELAKYQYEKVNKKEALKILKEIAGADSSITGSKASLIIGDDLSDNGNYKDALDVYLKTVTSYKTTAEIKSEALYKTAFCYYKLDGYEAAEQVIDRLKSNFPDSSWAEKGMQLLERMK